MMLALDNILIERTNAILLGPVSDSSFDGKECSCSFCYFQ